MFLWRNYNDIITGLLINPTAHTFDTFGTKAIHTSNVFADNIENKIISLNKNIFSVIVSVIYLHSYNN